MNITMEVKQLYVYLFLMHSDVQKDVYEKEQMLTELEPNKDVHCITK